MNRNDINSQCQAAKPYYYDYLYEQQEKIPEAISVHIACCSECQNEVHWLKQTDSEADEFSLQKLHAILHAAQMQMHCALINLPVSCSTIKSFLPTLAIPKMAVRISTPVTEHIHACVECTRDLETLKQLNLSPEELSCLSGIFIQHQNEGSVGNEKITSLLPKAAKKLRAEISRIMNRPDSGIVTYFRTKEGSELSMENSFTVEVKRKTTKKPKDDLPSRRAAVIETASRRPKWLFKPIAAAAAVLIIAILLFQNTSVKATDIGQIYETLKSVQNVIMTQYEIDNPNPVQTTWICQSLGIKLFETDGVITLYDINNKIQKSRTDPVSDIRQTTLDRNTVQSVAGTMQVPWGLLPFTNTSELPAGAVWEKVRPEGMMPGAEQIEIYDLFWSEEAMGNNVKINYHWQCQLDSATKRPIRVQWWTREPGQLDYEQVSAVEITYPTEDQIHQTIDQAGF